MEEISFGAEVQTVIAEPLVYIQGQHENSHSSTSSSLGLKKRPTLKQKQKTNKRTASDEIMEQIVPLIEAEPCAEEQMLLGVSSFASIKEVVNPIGNADGDFVFIPRERIVDLSTVTFKSVTQSSNSAEYVEFLT